jgi:hypothetical protein
MSMVPTMLVCTVLLALESPPAPIKADPADRAAYETARAKARRDADDQVRLALWCEANGLTNERLKHLALAVLANPAHAAARGLLGLVPYKGQWKTPEAIKSNVQEDDTLNAAMAEYARRRAHLANTAEANWRLALWCEQNGLRPEAQAHLAITVQLDPSREGAWKRLGYKRVKNRWVTDAQLAAEKAETEAQKPADKHWKPLLAKWRAWLTEKDPKKRAQAKDGLAALSDPRAVPAIWTTFATAGAAGQETAVKVLGQIDAPGSTRALAVLAVFSELPDVRSNATKTLQRRDPRDFAGELIGLLRDPIKYEVKPVSGPGSRGALFVNGQEFNVQRLYDPPAMPNIPIFPGEPIWFDAAGLPVIKRYIGPWTDHRADRADVSVGQYFGQAPVTPTQQQVIEQARRNPLSSVANPAQLARRPRDLTNDVLITTSTAIPVESNIVIPIGQIVMEYQAAAVMAQQQLAADVRSIEAYNQGLNEANQRVRQVLVTILGQSPGEKQEDWKAMWADYLGYSYKSPPEQPRATYVEEVPLVYIPRPTYSTETLATGPSTATSVAMNRSFGFSCFEAGTLVQTLTGALTIESIRAGDQVLGQDAQTGKLEFHPVVAVYHNKPDQILRISLDGDQVGATPIHRFWKVGKGWTMARELQPGDAIRAIGGIARITSIEKGPVEPVYNLKVADGSSFFVGRNKVLVHDNSLVEPVLKPFDAMIGAATQTGPP